MYTIQSLEGKLILLATILASAMAFLDGTVVNIAIPTIQTNLHATITDIQWLINGYTLMLATLILISGSLGDRFGRKKVFVYGIALFITASLLCGFAHSILQLIIFRIIQGIGAAMMIPGSLSIIDSSFDASHRGRAIGLWSGFAGGVATLGPFLGGWLIQTFGWSSIFYINIPLGLLALYMTLRFVPESKNNEACYVDIWGTVWIFLGLFGISYGLISAPTSGWFHPLVLFSFIGGIICCIIFVFGEMRAKESLIPFTIFKSSLVTGANIATFFLYFALSGVIFFLVLNLQQIQHFSPLLAGMSMLPSIILITFLSGAGGLLADKIGPRLPMVIGPCLVGTGMSILALPGDHPNYFLQYFPGLILFGLGMALVIAPLTKSALAVERRYSGAASGVNNAISRISGLFAIALLGAIILGLFSLQLSYKMRTSHLPLQEQKEIMNQSDRLGSIQIPAYYPQADKVSINNSIDSSFMYAFRWIMGINACLAFFSGAVAVVTIKNKKN